jgi:hypothetical protein
MFTNQLGVNTTMTLKEKAETLRKEYPAIFKNQSIAKQYIKDNGLHHWSYYAIVEHMSKEYASVQSPYKSMLG